MREDSIGYHVDLKSWHSFVSSETDSYRSRLLASKSGVHERTDRVESDPKALCSYELFVLYLLFGDL